jgi:YHS domain-containing protein
MAHGVSGVRAFHSPHTVRNQEVTMTRQRDPVCGMMVEPAKAYGPVTHRQREYYFCSEECMDRFNADPDRYVAETQAPVSSAREPEREPSGRAEPPFTTEGIPAPKFGSAGSGGLEYEPPPKDRRG